MNSIFSFLALVCFVQLCSSASTVDVASTESLDSLIVAEIDEIGTNLKGKPAIKVPKSDDNLVKYLKRFRKNTPENEAIKAVWNLMGMALKRPVCDTKKTNLRQVGNESNGGGIAVEKMKKLQQQLSEILETDQIQPAMEILQGFRAEATQKEKETAILDLISSAKLSFKVECVNDTNGKRV